MVTTPSIKARVASVERRRVRGRRQRPEHFSPVAYGLVHDNPRAGRTVQQSLEVKAGELIIGVLSNMGCKGGHCTVIAGFQLGKRREIILSRRVFILLVPKGLKSTQSFRPPPQNKVPDRSASKIFRHRRQCGTDANAGAELFVGIFQSRRNIHGIAIGRVVEETTATKITDDRLPCMNTYPL